MVKEEKSLQEDFKKRYAEAAYNKVEMWYLRRPHPFEVSPTRMYKHTEVPVIIREHRGYEGGDPKTAWAQKRGAWWEMMGNTRVDHAEQVRGAIYPNEKSAENHFLRTDVDENTSYEELLLNTESGLKDLGSLKDFLLKVQRKKRPGRSPAVIPTREGCGLQHDPSLDGRRKQIPPPNLE
jgi:hypothetical protein